jgi:poly-gamma-glutamate synthesis protein (capsule biosynthesis protein)
MRYLIIATVLVLTFCLAVQAQQEAWPWVLDGPEITSVLLMGDNNFQYREHPEDAFKYVMPTFEAADLRILNLEGAFAGSSDDPKNPDIPHKLWKHSEPDQVGALVAARIDAVGVANNVTYPWQAMMKSLEVLDRAGIPYAGGGENLEAAHRPVILEANGLKVGFMQYAATIFPYNHEATEVRPGIASIKVYTAYQPPRNLDKPGQPPYVITWLDEESEARMVEGIRKLRKQVDIVIVSYHWGVSGTMEPVSYQSDIGRAVIDAGADVVFGHGPHKYQKVEVYNGKPIFHSLAQFIFDDTLEGNRSRRMREGLLLRLAIKESRIHSVSLVPSWREDDNFVRLYDPNTGKGRELFGYLNSVNEGGAELKLEGKEIVIQGLKYK